MLTIAKLLEMRNKADIIASTYTTPKKQSLRIRLYNSKPSLASIPALSTIKPKNRYENVSGLIVDYIPGTSTRTGNCKIDIDTGIELIEDLIALIDDPTYIVPKRTSNYEVMIRTKEGLVTKSSASL